MMRIALRVLAKSPVFTLLAVSSLALGIGANTAIFSLLDQMLLRVLPVRAPEQLVLLKFSGAETGSSRTRDDQSLFFSYPMYRDLRDRNTVFQGLLATLHADVAVNWRGQTERGSAEVVSGNYFEVLGVRAATGRVLQPSDDLKPEAAPVATLSYGFWQRRFGGDPAVVGQTIRLNDHPFNVVGVAQPGFQSVIIGDAPDVFVPMMMKAQVTPGWNDLDVRRSRWLEMVGRLKPDMSILQAEAAINPLWYSLREMEYQQIRNPSRRLQTEFLKTHLSLLDGARGFSPLRKSFTAPLLVLMAMVGVVLLIACANVAGLLLARAAGRHKEIAIRFALGASRIQVIRQLLLESVLLSLGGGALGVAVASWSTALLLRAVPVGSSLAVAFSSRPDLRMMGYTLALSVVTGLLFGLAPAFQATHSDLSGSLKEQSGSLAGSGGQARFRKVLVAGQTALSLLLMIGAGLFARSLYNLKNENLGFRAEHLLQFSVNPKLNGYSAAQITSIYDRMRSTLAAEPGVRSVASSRLGLIKNSSASSNITVAGYQAKESEDMSPSQDSVSPGFFATLGIPVLAGRDFTAGDALGAPKVAIVNETFARYFFGRQSPVGHWFGFGAGDIKLDIQIVGLVKDTKYQKVRETTPRFIYLPCLQDQQPGGMTFYVRTSQDPASAAGMIRQQVQQVDPALPIDNMKTMDQQIDDNIWLERIAAMLSMSFGLLASLLAAIGLYGVLAYMVARRTRELGIRMALGATRGRILKLVMAEVAVVTGAGMVVAIPLSILATRYLKSQLYELSNTDPPTLIGAVLFLAIIGLLAAYVPARRAMRVDPLSALRWE